MSVPTDITHNAGIRGADRLDAVCHGLCHGRAGIGVLNPLVFAVADDPLGVTTPPIAAYRP